MRYRPGDVYRCIRLKNDADGLHFPQFEYIDRVPTIIDIAGFTRITENSINQVIDLSGIDVANWCAMKKYDEDKRSYMQMYVELSEKASLSALASSQLLCEHLSIYFKYYDNDYEDLKSMLGIDPLSVTVLPCGTMAEFEKTFGRPIRKINASRQDEIELLRLRF